MPDVMFIDIGKNTAGFVSGHSAKHVDHDLCFSLVTSDQVTVARRLRSGRPGTAPVGRERERRRGVYWFWPLFSGVLTPAAAAKAADNGGSRSWCSVSIV
jgi:hypothetical protein